VPLSKVFNNQTFELVTTNSCSKNKVNQEIQEIPTNQETNTYKMNATITNEIISLVEIPPK